MAGPGQHFPMSVAGSMPGQMMTSQVSGSSTYSQSQISQMSGMQQHQSFTSTAPQTTTQTQPQMMSPTKSVNTVSLCKRGQDTNQELVNKLLDIFKTLKAVQLPNGTNAQLCHDRKKILEEGLKQSKAIFNRLRFIYERVNEFVADPNENPEEVLVPLKGDPLYEKNTNTDAYRYSSEEQKQLIEQLQLKNRQIKELIDKIRTIIWEINTMIVMRKT